RGDGRTQVFIPSSRTISNRDDSNSRTVRPRLGRLRSSLERQSPPALAQGAPPGRKRRGRGAATCPAARCQGGGAVIAGRLRSRTSKLEGDGRKLGALRRSNVAILFAT